MSNILTPGQADALTAEKRTLQDEELAATSQGEANRIAKKIVDIQRQLDDDLNERRRTGFDEARANASKIAANVNRAHGDSSPELRALVTPGSPTTDMWVKPSREISMGKPDDFRTTPYLTTDANVPGGDHFFVPELYARVMTGLLAASGVLEAQPTMIVTNHLRPIQIPVLTADATASAGTEGSAASDANTTGSAIELGAYRYDGKFSVSAELLMASEYDLPTLLSTFAIRSLSNKTSAMLALGNGTTQPLGLFTASAVTIGKTCASPTAATSAEMIQMMKAIPKGYRKAAKVVVSDVLHTAMSLWVYDDGEYALHSLESGSEMFTGKPLFTEPQADQSGMSASELHAVAGDFSGYFVRTTPLFFRRSDADPLNPVFTFAIWLDAKVVDASALVSLKMGT